ncbi:hypothetical protein NWE55_13940 [Myroides albus]|uniref:lipocalin family protein n=1 Tax=Myroides albus TaxID=2562892 RepID=UPI00215938C2|nr:lipocalin family protein [Myroides albus]UVD79215.1 hypothetical protein NWE55_13940 [Myroides albus]
MGRFINIFASVCLVLVGMTLQSCSAEDNNMVDTNPAKEVKSVNIEKKWIAAHFNFTPECDRVSKEAYQKSSIEISLKNGTFTAVDQYSLKQSKGVYVLEGNRLTMKSDRGNTFIYKIVELNQRDAVVEAIGDKNILSIELVSFE